MRMFFVQYCREYDDALAIKIYKRNRRLFALSLQNDLHIPRIEGLTESSRVR